MTRWVLGMSIALICCSMAAAVPAEDTPPGEAVAAPAASPEAAPAIVDEAYVIGPGDVLDISIWKEAALTKVVPVLPDGTISFPLTGGIRAAGRTAAELKAEIEERLRTYVPEPVLTLSVVQVNSLVIYVIGRVNGPGRYLLNTRVNVLQALAMAGGLNPFADENDVKIFREREGKTEIIEFRYKDVLKGKRLEQNIRLERGDVIVVP